MYVFFTQQRINQTNGKQDHRTTDYEIGKRKTCAYYKKKNTTFRQSLILLEIGPFTIISRLRKFY